MTLVDVKNALLSHFISSSTFDITEDTKHFKLDPEEVGPDFVANIAHITEYALEDLVKLGVLAKVRDGFYVLSQPLTQLNQTVVITPFTALMLADIVNGWSRKTGEMKETGYVVNKLAVTDRDVSALCQLCAMLLSRDDEPEEVDDEEDEEDEN